MSKDKEEKIVESKAPTTDDDEAEAAVEESDEDDVEGHVSAADVWAPGVGTNKWRRRR